MDRKYRTENHEGRAPGLFRVEGDSYVRTILVILVIVHAYVWLIQSLIQTLA